MKALGDADSGGSLMQHGSMQYDKVRYDKVRYGNMRYGTASGAGDAGRPGLGRRSDGDGMPADRVDLRLSEFLVRRFRSRKLPFRGIPFRGIYLHELRRLGSRRGGLAVRRRAEVSRGQSGGRRPSGRRSAGRYGNRCGGRPVHQRLGQVLCPQGPSVRRGGRQRIPQHNSPLAVTPTGSASPVTVAPGGRAWVKLTFVQVQGRPTGTACPARSPWCTPRSSSACRGRERTKSRWMTVSSPSATTR